MWKLIKLGITYFDIVIDFKQKSKLKLHCSMSKYQWKLSKLYYHMTPMALCGLACIEKHRGRAWNVKIFSCFLVVRLSLTAGNKISYLHMRRWQCCEHYVKRVSILCISLTEAVLKVNLTFLDMKKCDWS